MDLVYKERIGKMWKRGIIERMERCEKRQKVRRDKGDGVMDVEEIVL